MAESREVGFYEGVKALNVSEVCLSGCAGVGDEEVWSVEWELC